MSQYGIIFDMDGVLVDSYHTHFESWKRTVSTRGIEVTEEQFAKTFGQTNDVVISNLKPGADEKEIREWDAEKERVYREILMEKFPAMDGATDLLKSLHEDGARLAIGSSGPQANVDCVLRGLPGAELFDAWVTADDISHSKPHPEVFLKAAERLEVPPERCAVIEDSLAGVEGARRAGMTVIALTGTASGEKLAAKAHLVVNSLRELTPQRLKEWIDGSH